MTTTDIDGALVRLEYLKSQSRVLDAEIQQLQDNLTASLEAGDLDASFQHNDWTFSYCEGRMTTTYSAEAKAAIKRLQEADVQMGRATQNRGAGFWTIKPPAV